MSATTFHDGRVRLFSGDCLDVLRTLAECSVDSVVTDPPYGIAFMGKAWDGAVAFRPETWAEVLRVLKPGGHLAAFGGTRTYHRLACAIEDGGFEIRDQLAWVFGSGFPKSHDVSKGIDRAAGAEREIVGRYQPPNGSEWNLANDVAGSEVGAVGHSSRSGSLNITAPATDAARAWEGWGSSLKPAWEPICLARKPLSEKTIAANVLRWGCGAINIDGCRVATDDALGGGAEKAETVGRFTSEGWRRPWMDEEASREAHAARVRSNVVKAQSLGRWPANLVHDGSPEVLAGFPETGVSSGGKGEASEAFVSAVSSHTYGFKPMMRANAGGLGDAGSAARFFASFPQDEEPQFAKQSNRLFYSSKADSSDRFASRHPTVKPVALMQWLVRLITPPNGTVLDCFAGTGTTGEAAIREGLRAVLIEREAEYLADIARRMQYVHGGPDERRHAIIKAKGKVESAGPLFAGMDAEAAE